MTQYIQTTLLDTIPQPRYPNVHAFYRDEITLIAVAPPNGLETVSYTHLTLPTKRIV